MYPPKHNLGLIESVFTLFCNNSMKNLDRLLKTIVGHLDKNRISNI